MIEKGNALSRDLSKLCARVHKEGPFNYDWSEKGLIQINLMQLFAQSL